ncbi:hypothetical protein LTR22_000974 [Elasticomyces elasticus]|nr:hypothetical protein LTR22_000974 [Elasticomyces elasticus]KAK4922780.1 hypothetical protein LTR49_009968 [Elasticomyces elasticus]
MVFGVSIQGLLPASKMGLTATGTSNKQIASRGMSTIPSKTRFRCIPEPTGGTCTFSDSSRSTSADCPKLIDHIGTIGLFSCVGVYCALPDNRCFVAHISAWTQDDDDVSEPFEEYCGVEDGETIQREVLSRLQSHAKANAWSPSEANTASLIIACPTLVRMMVDGRILTFTGAYVARAVREFFNAPNAQVKKNWGFVVHRSTGAVDLLNRSDGEPDPPSCMDHYEMVNEADLDDWKVIVERHN